jgi:predicted PurR-regulated permease PerM
MRIIIKYLQLILFSSLILYFGKVLFIPLLFGLFIAIVLYPVCKWLEGKGWSKPFAITACLLIVALLFTCLFFLVLWQLVILKADAPAVLTKLAATMLQLQIRLVKNFGVTTNMQNDWIQKITGNLGGLLTTTLQITFNMLFILVLTPVYTVLFLYHRKVFIRCLQAVTPDRYQQRLHAIIHQTIITYFTYIKGMVLVYLIVGILNSIGLLALGVNHAILFGMLCAVMTIIPYFGITISGLLPISVVWMQTGSFWYPLGVIVIFSVVQYLEANIIFPKVVGAQLNISTIAMLVAIFTGGIIWGAAGMVLFIPFVAILKIISDHIEEWKPVNILLSRI